MLTYSRFIMVVAAFLLFFLIISDVQAASSVVFSKQTQDEIAGQLVYEGKLAGSSAQTAARFSAKKSDDMLSIKIEIGGKSVVVEKGYDSRSKEFFIDYDDESSSKKLGEKDKTFSLNGRTKNAK